MFDNSTVEKFIYNATPIEMPSYSWWYSIFFTYFGVCASLMGLFNHDTHCLGNLNAE